MNTRENERRKTEDKRIGSEEEGRREVGVEYELKEQTGFNLRGTRRRWGDLYWLQ